MRRVRLRTGGSVAAIVAAAVLLVAQGDAGSAEPAIAVSASPALKPAFQANIHDYVNRCRHGRIRVTVAVAHGVSAALDGKRLRSRKSTHTLDRRVDEATTITARRGGRTARYHVRCLPSDFPAWRVRRNGRPQAGWYLASPGPGGDRDGYVAIFDRHGVPLWWMRAGNRAAALLPHGRIALACCPHWSDPFTIHRLDGSAVGDVRASDAMTDDHEFRLLPNGHYLILGTRPRGGVDLSRFGGPSNATVLDGVVQELTPGGQVVWSWSTNGHIPLSATGRWYGLSVLEKRVLLPGPRWGYDIIHLNSAEPYGHDVLISSRHTDAIYAVNRATGEIEWKLGGTRSPQSLKLTGPRGAPHLFGGQHDARVLPDGTITVHDNQTSWHHLPRALRIRVDPAHRRARIIEDVPATRGPFSSCCGSARRLPGGDWVISWGQVPRFAELTRTGRPVLEIDLKRAGAYSFRVEPIARGRLSAAALRAGMDAIARRGSP